MAEFNTFSAALIGFTSLNLLKSWYLVTKFPQNNMGKHLWGSEMLPNLSRIHSMKRLRDGFKTKCTEGSRNLSADALSSDVLSNIQGLRRSELRAVVSFL